MNGRDYFQWIIHGELPTMKSLEMFWASNSTKTQFYSIYSIPVWYDDNNCHPFIDQWQW